MKTSSSIDSNELCSSCDCIDLDESLAFAVMLLTLAFFSALFYHLKLKLFTKKHGRKHSITGLLYLLIIIIGLLDSFEVFPLSSYSIVSSSSSSSYSWVLTSFALNNKHRFLLDIFLGITGTLLPLFAANEFGHKQIYNIASGTLDEHATVTHAEMIEHSFYQLLNLFQIIFFHIITYFHDGNNDSRSINNSNSNSNSNVNSSINNSQSNSSNYNSFFSMKVVLCLALVTLPWLARNLFPVHKFSDNYTKIDEKSSNFIRIMYRIKKYQYVFYKHFVLHGLNITVAVLNIPIAMNPRFRLFWMLLNTSYTMEFFLQTLVKKNAMRQETMLSMQKVLMLAASLSAIFILKLVDFKVASISLILNFANRKHDFLNTIVLGCLFAIYTQRVPVEPS